MASTVQGHSSFPPRSAYPSGKLPDRTALNHNIPPFGSSSLARRPDQQGGREYLQQQQQQQQPPPLPPQLNQQQGRPGGEKDTNALNELSEEQREEVNEAFSLFDLDRDRHLDYHELRVALRALGFSLPKPELIHILTVNGVPRASSSQNKNPRVTTAPHDQPSQQHPSQLLIPHHAFAQVAAQKILARDPREEIDRAFDLFDTEQKGYIDLEDLKRVARELGETGLEEEELRAMIEEFDLEGRGGVGREAFVGICLQ